jgi:beta-lactamase class A
MFRWLLLCLILAVSSPAVAQTAAPKSPFEIRAQELVGILQSGGRESEFFAPSFLKAIPASQIREIANSLIAQNGDVIGVEKIEPRGAQSGTISIDYAKATILINMTIEAMSPNQVIGLLITSVITKDDGPDKIRAELQALPGTVSLLVQPVGGVPILAVEADREQAIGSSFKLWLLAEAARAVGKGERRWSDVIPLGPPGLPSGIVQAWPKSSPMTLHSLATLMISISDNTATDTLLFALGRERVGRMVAVTGHAAAAHTVPILSTTEAFALKMEQSAHLRRPFQTGNPAARTAVLNQNLTRLGMGSIDTAQLGGPPRFIGIVEWFASPADMARTLNWLRLNGGKDALAILAVNPGVSEADTERFAYLGYKGGSETGVIAMNFLVRAKSGNWYTVTGSWNNPAAPVDDKKFAALMSRALRLIP